MRNDIKDEAERIIKKAENNVKGKEGADKRSQEALCTGLRIMFNLIKDFDTK